VSDGGLGGVVRSLSLRDVDDLEGPKRKASVSVFVDFPQASEQEYSCPTRERDRLDELSQGSDGRTLDDMDPTITMDPFVSFSNMILAASLAQ
jgi:hypothetical protein